MYKMKKLVLLAFLLSSLLLFTNAYREVEDDVDSDDNEIEELENIYDDINDDLPKDIDNEDEEQNVQDPMPFRFRRAVRRIRVRVRLRRLKCPLRCASYYTCLAKSKGLVKLFCNKLKKSCHC